MSETTKELLQGIFWLSAGLVLYSQLLYPLILGLTARFVKQDDRREFTELPFVSLVIAAYSEGSVIAQKVENALALDYPKDRFEVIVACDGSPDQTAQRAREAGAHKVLELPRGGKVRAQDNGVEAARGQIVAFSDANSFWQPTALRELVAPFADPAIGYVCGQVRFENDEGTNQEGLYWRYEMWLRARESKLASVTGGNGAIYATRRESYIEVDPVMGHDLSFPFNMVKTGWRAVYAPAAQATEKMVPSIEGEFRRKRRMMSHAWPIVLNGGLLWPRGYSARYFWMIYSHRALRYGAPALHIAAFVASAMLAPVESFYALLLGAQLLVLAAAVVAPKLRVKPFLIARYYVLATTSLAAGLWDFLRHGTTAGWSPPEGTR